MLFGGPAVLLETGDWLEVLKGEERVKGMSIPPDPLFLQKLGMQSPPITVSCKCNGRQHRIKGSTEADDFSGCIFITFRVLPDL